MLEISPSYVGPYDLDWTSTSCIKFILQVFLNVFLLAIRFARSTAIPTVIDRPRTIQCTVATVRVIMRFFKKPHSIDFAETQSVCWKNSFVRSYCWCKNIRVFSASPHYIYEKPFFFFLNISILKKLIYL